MDDLKLKKLIDTAIYYLETIDDQNFDSKMQSLNKIAREIAHEKKKAAFSGSNEEFLFSKSHLKEKAKLLKEKFDNVIEMKKDEQDLVSMQLKHIENQKKLAIYNR